jgi:dihydroneopterin aldolase
VRFRKAKGKKPGQVTMSDGEIMDCCYQWLRSKGYNLAERSVMVIANSTTDKAGRRRHAKVEVRFDLKN